ncbi:transcription elongation factor GreA [Nocardioides baekrokdamisoli]|uniref:Transcription elongation factor GreA n=1 Tax=Nocardioides baekrokdamisoli TaxID=1804624 RepID=A0A3G9II27_9ACTN|nr:GreA/GreB family elongation factor [Nocardioides baekrokdamisoli]BBH18006.1 transcription elongation factor GreA [Nocardioides baekrokdamisoli]
MTQSTDTQATHWLSAGAHEALTAQLADMRGPQLTKIVAEISAARDEGDLKENGGYHAAREAQGRLVGEADALEVLLRTSFTDAPVADGVVAPGVVVTYKFEGDDDDEAETFLLGAIEMKPFAHGLDVFSPAAPLGAALLGHTAGDTVSYTGPTGREIKVQIVSAKPFED